MLRLYCRFQCLIPNTCNACYMENYCYLHNAIEYTANKNTGTPLYIPLYYIQPSQHVPCICHIHWVGHCIFNCMVKNNFGHTLLWFTMEYPTCHMHFLLPTGLLPNVIYTGPPRIPALISWSWMGCQVWIKFYFLFTLRTSAFILHCYLTIWHCSDNNCNIVMSVLLVRLLFPGLNSCLILKACNTFKELQPLASPLYTLSAYNTKQHFLNFCHLSTW